MRRAYAILSLSIALAAGLAGSASAAITNLEHRDLVPGDSTEPSRTRICQPQKRALGAGGEVAADGQGEVVLRNIRPAADLKSVSVQGIESETGASAPWTVGVHVVCATPPPGLERVAAESVSSSANKSVTASCPAGKRVLGTGGEVSGGAGQVILDDIRPNAGLTGVNVQGAEDENGFSGSWSVIAYAICSNPVTGLERVVAESPSDSFGTKMFGPSCPAGKQVLGAGYELTGGAGRAVEDMIFAPDLTQISVRATEDEDGTLTNCAHARDRDLRRDGRHGDRDARHEPWRPRSDRSVPGRQAGDRWRRAISPSATGAWRCARSGRC